MQSNISCDAAKCVHNKKGLCDALMIHVRCSEKAVVGDAHCNSYAYPIPNASSKLLMEMGKDITADRTSKGLDVLITCSVHTCRYNCDYSCTAKEIKVLDPNSTPLHDCACATYRPR